MANPIVDALGPFIWGAGGAKKTPEEIARDKEVAAEMLMKAGNTSPVQHWSQGAARVVDALGGVLKQRRAEAAGAENTTYNEGIINNLLSGGSSSIPSPEAAAQVSATSPASAVNDPVQSVLDAGGAKNTDFIQYANQGATRSAPLNEKLVGALGFLPDLGVQMQVFSGGQGGIGEGGPRTGSTRHDHGNAADVFFTKDGRRLDWSDPNDRPVFEEIVRRGKAAGITGFGAGDGYMQPGSMHLGFGAPAVWGAGGKGSNAPDWLRQAYNGAGPQQVASLDHSAGMQPQTASQAIEAQAPVLPEPQIVGPAPAVAGQPLEVAGGGGRPSVFEQPQGAPQQAPGMNEALVRAMTDPRATPQTRAVAQALMQQQMAQQQAAQEMRMKQADPAYQMGLEKSRLEIDRLRNPRAEVPDAVQALDLRAQRAGLQPGTREYQDFMVNGGSKGISISNEGSIPQGYQAVRDTEGRVTRYEPIPGGPADNTRQQAAASQNKLTSTDVITNAAQLARKAMEAPGILPTTGTVGNLVSGVAETNAAELRRQVAVLKSNATVENLNSMRAASPTGGALGAVSDSENAMLSAKSGTLDPSSPNFARDLDDYERTLLRIVHGKEGGDRMFEQTRAVPDKKQAPSAEAVDNSPAPEGVDPELWKYMPPEDRKLWQ